MRRLTRTPKVAEAVPEIVPAAVLSAPQPVLPLRFLTGQSHRQEAERGFLGLFTVHEDGTADVEIVASTGSDALDALALHAARRYRFRPATLDGTPVESYLRVRIEFDCH